MLLRPTIAALRDLQLPASAASLPLNELADLHPVLKAFVDRRGQSPTGQETTRLPVTRATVYNLHSGTARGLTWHELDDEFQVVWLLGVAWHEGGGNSDAYDVLKARDAKDQLFPTAADYLALEPEPIDFIAKAATQLPALLARAHLAPDTEVRDKVGGALSVRVLLREVLMGGVALRETWVGIRLPPEGNVVMPRDLIAFVLAGLFPDNDPQDLRAEAVFPDSAPDSAEIVYSYMPLPNL